MSIIKFSVAKQRANDEARAVITLINAKFAAVPLPANASPGASPGKLLLAANRAPIGGDPLKHFRQIREETARGLRNAKSHLNKHAEVARWMLKAAEFIRHGTDLPDPPEHLPGGVLADIKAIPHDAAAGLTDKAYIADKIEEGAIRALEAYDEAIKAFRRYESTASVAITRQSGLLAHDYGLYAMAAGLAKKADRMSGIHRSLEMRRRGTPKVRRAS
jgi:hypothetical protein